MYLYERPGWPHFTFDLKPLQKILEDNAGQRAALARALSQIDPNDVLDLALEAAAIELTSSCAIEKDVIGQKSLLKALKSALQDPHPHLPFGREGRGAALLLDLKKGGPLTHDRLFWLHRLLLGNQDRNLFEKIIVGRYRTCRMQVISGTAARPKVCFEAVPPLRVLSEMDAFLTRFNGPEHDELPVIKAAVAHLWFVTIHPFDDGNGRLSRALSAMALLRRGPLLPVSLSEQILKAQSSYYKILQQTQQGALDITSYVQWFAGLEGLAICEAQNRLERQALKRQFWREHQDLRLNARQIEILNALLTGELPSITAGKWAVLCRSSMEEAQSDIREIQALNLIEEIHGRRSLKYALKKEILDN